MVQSRVHGGQCKAGDHVTTRDIEVNFSTPVSLSVLDLNSCTHQNGGVAWEQSN